MYHFEGLCRHLFYDSVYCTAVWTLFDLAAIFSDGFANPFSLIVIMTGLSQVSAKVSLPVLVYQYTRA